MEFRSLFREESNEEKDAMIVDRILP